MKATSKLISVVLILAMCLSLFATSAFADDQIVVSGGSIPGGNSTGGFVSEGEYSGSQETTNSETPAASDNTAAGSEGEAEESGAAILRNGVETKYDSLTAALNAAEDGDTVKLYSKELSYASALQINASFTLDLNGRTINFESNEEKPAAFVVNGDSDVVVKNGKINLVGKAAEGENAAAGFQDLFVANEEEASFQQESLNVVRFTPEAWAEANKPVSGEQKTEEVHQPATEEKTEQPAENTKDNSADEEEQEKLEVLPVVTPVEGQENEQAEGQTPAAEDEAGEDQAADIVEDKAEGEEGEGEADPAAEGEADPTAEGEAGEDQAADIVEDKAEGEEGEGEADPAAEGEGETDPAQIEGEGAAADELEVNEEPVNITEESEKPAELPEKVEGDNSTEEKTVTVSGVDSVTGAEVTVTLKGKNPPEGLTVSVSTVSVDADQAADEENSFLALDITLMLDGEEYHMQEHKEDVSVATVYVSHPALAGKDVVVDHIVENADGSTYQKTENSAASTDEGVVFNTTSFSTFIFFPYEPAGNIDSALSGSVGDVHHKDIKIKNLSGEVWKKIPGGDLVFEISGGAAPSSISIVDPEYASSGNAEYYKAGVLRYITDYSISPNPATDPTADPFTVTISGASLKNVPIGKWAVVFWFQDITSAATTPVYIIKPIIVAAKAEITAVSPLEDGILTFEKCDYTPVQIKITEELTALSLTKADGKAYITFDLVNKSATVQTVDFAGNPKTYKIGAGGAYEVTDYTAYDPLSHEFVSSKSLNIYASLLKWLPFGNDYSITVTTKDAGPTTLPLHIVPGISVADGMTDYIKGKNTWIKFVACAPIDYDLDGKLAISIGGQRISHDYYSISDDHMTLWIYRNLLDQLRSNNSYTLTARLWMLDGPNNKITWENRTAQFNILAAGSTSYKSPKTGDNANIGLWAAVLVVSGAAVVALIPKKKKF